MNKFLLTFAALIALAVASAVGWVMLGSAGESAAAEHDSLEAEFEAAAPDEGLTAPALAASGAGAALEQDSARDEAEAPPAPEPEKPATRLTGRIVDLVGKPLAGAKVYAAPPDRNQRSPLDGPPWDEPRRKRREATTDAEGRFAVAVLGSGSMRFAARAGDYAPLDLEDVLVVAETDNDLGTLELVPGVRISGRVVDARGQGVGEVELYQPRDPQYPVWMGKTETGTRLGATDSNGNFELGPLLPGPWVILAHHERHPDAVARSEHADPGERVSDVRIEFPSSGSIGGVVRIKAGAGAPGPTQFSVVASYTGARERGPGEPDFRYRRGRCDASGTYSIAGLFEDEPYRLTLFWHRNANDEQGIEMPRQQADVVIDGQRADFTLEPFSVLVHHPVDARTGAALEELDGRIVVKRPDGRESSITSTTRSLGDGRWTETIARPPEPGDVATLVVTKEGYRPLRVSPVEITLAGEVDVGAVKLEPLAELRARVVSAATGEPVEGARVMVRLEQGDDGLRTLEEVLEAAERQAERGPSGQAPRLRSRETDKDGWTKLNASADAAGLACAVHSDWPSSELVEVRFGPPGANSVVFEVQPGTTARVTVVDSFGAPASGVSVVARWSAPEGSESPQSLRNSSRRLRTDSAGVALFSGLLPGPTHFVLEEERIGGQSGKDGRAGREARVELAPERVNEVALVATPRGTLSGRVFDSGQRVAGAVLEFQPGSVRDDGGRGWGGGITARTSPQGEYSIPRLGAGRWTVTVRHPQRLVPHREEFVAAGADERRDFRLSGSAVSGNVVDPRGTGIGGAKLTLGELRADRNARDGKRFVPLSTNSRVLSNEGGWFEARGLPTGVDLQIEVSHPDYQDARSDVFRLGPDEIRSPLDVTLRPGATLVVEVATSDGRVARGRVNAQRIADERGKNVRSGPRSGNLDGRSRARISGLPGGKYVVTLERTYGNQQKPSRLEIELEAGRVRELRFDVP